MIVVDQIGALGKGVLCQPGLKRGVAEEPAPRIHQEFRCAAQQKAEALDGALEHVVQDAQDLLVIGSSRLTHWTACRG